MSSDTDATLEGVAAAAALAESELDKAVRELNEDASIMNPSNQTTYKVGTLSFSVDTDNPTVNPPTQVGRLYTKEHRPDVGSKEEKELITSITVNQYGEFKMMTTNVTDAENLKNNLSITQRLQLTQDCFERYDLLDPCNIIFPSENNSAIPLTEDGVVKFRDLFTHHRRLSVPEVAASCEYYQKYVTYQGSDNSKCTFAKELTWSYSHFRTHVESSLYENVNAVFKMFPPVQQGGPLFLKLLLDQLVVSNEASLEALVVTTTTYDIKTMSKDEDIIEVIKLLSSITDTIIAIRDDTEHPLPEKYLQKILKVFQTTSVEKFNTSFQKLEDDLVFNRRYKKTANSTALTALGGDKFFSGSASTNLQLDNNPASAAFLWQFARETYREFKENGVWDAATRTIDGSSFFGTIVAGTAMDRTMYKNAPKRSITTVLIGIEQRIRTKLLGMAAHDNASRAINAHGFGVLLQMKREANVSSSIIHTPGTKRLVAGIKMQHPSRV